MYQISQDVALVQTVDFFPPIVDDPHTFGLVAAANALSDIYAMGGKPLIGMNIVAFPIDQPREILKEILRGGVEKAREAGLTIVGGHTIDDPEPKYGLAITGVVKPGEQLTNVGVQPGDVLVLTKPLGSGIIATAGKLQQVDESVLQEAIRHMATLNAAASEAALEVGVNACTDITGYGLIGHLRGMLEASGVSARVYFSKVPQISGAWELATERDIFPSGMERNRAYLDPAVSWDNEVPALGYRILYDPQTSGGLLLSAPRARADKLLQALVNRGVEHSALVGEILADGHATVHVVG